jgi:parvulin-like peptidyl-prolyl isomerase
MPPVEEADIRAAFERESASFGARPAMAAFREVVIVPQPSDSARAAARTEAERILGLIREGEDFAELARRFSDDGSGANGGDFGWYRPGQTVPEFDETLFRLARGEMSGVVETVYGAHIIRLDRVRGGERNGSHILIAAETTPADVDRARSRAAEIRAAVAAGASIMDFENEGDDLGLPRVVSERPIDQLPGAFPLELRGARVGDVLGPIDVPLGPGVTAFAVVEVTSVREAGSWAYEDARDQIRAVLQDQMFRDRLVEKLRSETYVEIRY